MSARVVVLPLLAIALVACEPVPGDGSSNGSSSSDGGATPNLTKNVYQSTLDAPKLCSLLINQCGDSSTMTDCIATYETVRVSAECAQKVTAATCSDISALEDLCFPPCTTQQQNCNDDGTITTCTQGSQFTLTCAGICKNSGTTYSGTCGTTSKLGDTSAQPQCWCQQ